jgi:hypothetical protein
MVTFTFRKMHHAVVSSVQLTQIHRGCDVGCPEGGGREREKLTSVRSRFSKRKCNEDRGTKRSGDIVGGTQN